MYNKMINIFVPDNLDGSASVVLALLSAAEEHGGVFVHHVDCECHPDIESFLSMVSMAFDIKQLSKNESYEIVFSGVTLSNKEADLVNTIYETYPHVSVIYLMTGKEDKEYFKKYVWTYSKYDETFSRRLMDVFCMSGRSNIVDFVSRTKKKDPSLIKLYWITNGLIKDNVNPFTAYEFYVADYLYGNNRNINAKEILNHVVRGEYSERQ